MVLTTNWRFTASASGQHFLSLILYLYLWIPSTDHTGCSYELVLEFKLCSHILFWKHCIYLGQKWRLVFCILILNFYSMTFVALWRLSPYDVCRLMRFVALWCFSQYDVCHIMVFVALWRLLHYDVCRLWPLLPYDVCRLITFVALWRFSHYDVCRNITFVAFWHLSVMTFVASWRLLPYYVCRIMRCVAYDVCCLWGLMACRREQVRV